MRLCLATLLCVLGLGCGTDDAVSDPLFGHTHSTEMELYQITFDGTEVPHTVGVNQYVVLITTRDGVAVENAQIQLKPWMPDHGHGSDRDPTVVEEAPGRYVFTEVSYTMPGRWQLITEVRAQPGVDSMVVELDVQ